MPAPAASDRRSIRRRLRPARVRGTLVGVLVDMAGALPTGRGCTVAGLTAATAAAVPTGTAPTGAVPTGAALLPAEPTAAPLSRTLAGAPAAAAPAIAALRAAAFFLSRTGRGGLGAALARSALRPVSLRSAFLLLPLRSGFVGGASSRATASSPAASPPAARPATPGCRSEPGPPLAGGAKPGPDWSRRIGAAGWKRGREGAGGGPLALGRGPVASGRKARGLLGHKSSDEPPLCGVSV